MKTLSWKTGSIGLVALALVAALGGCPKPCPTGQECQPTGGTGGGNGGPRGVVYATCAEGCTAVKLARLPASEVACLTVGDGACQTGNVCRADLVSGKQCVDGTQTSCVLSNGTIGHHLCSGCVWGPCAAGVAACPPP